MKFIAVKNAIASTYNDSIFLIYDRLRTRTPHSCNLIHLDNLGIKGNILAAIADNVNQLILIYKD